MKRGSSVNGCAGGMSYVHTPYHMFGFGLGMMWVVPKKTHWWETTENPLRFVRNFITASQRYYSISTLLQHLHVITANVHVGTSTSAVITASQRYYSISTSLQQLHVITASPRYYRKCNVHIGTSTFSRMKVLDRCRNENTTPTGIKTFWR